MVYHSCPVTFNLWQPFWISTSEFLFMKQTSGSCISFSKILRAISGWLTERTLNLKSQDQVQLAQLTEVSCIVGPHFNFTIWMLCFSPLTSFRPSDSPYTFNYHLFLFLPRNRMLIHNLVTSAYHPKGFLQLDTSASLLSSQKTQAENLIEFFLSPLSTQYSFCFLFNPLAW